MPGTDHRKQSLYFPEEMLMEIQHEATRQDRSLSWIVQQAWKVARGDIQKMPSVNDVLSGRLQAASASSLNPPRSSICFSSGFATARA